MASLDEQLQRLDTKETIDAPFAQMEPVQTPTPPTTQDALATPTPTDPNAAAAAAPNAAAASNPAVGTSTPAQSSAQAQSSTPAQADPQAQPDPQALAAAQSQAAAAFAGTVQGKSQAGEPLSPQEVAAIAAAPALKPVYVPRATPEGNPASSQSLEPAAGNVDQARPGSSNSISTAATEPQPATADGTAPGNSGSTGWSGGTGGSMIGTSPSGAVPQSKTWQPPTARGLGLTG